MTVVDSVRPHALPSAPMTGPGAERPARDRIPRISGPALIAGARRAAPAVAVIGLVAGLVVLFAGPLGEGSAAHRRAVAEQAVNDELRARIDARLMPRLRAVSINGADERDEKPGWNRYIQPLDAGNFDIATFLKTLRELGFNGPVGLQCFGIGGDTREHLARSMDAWRKLNKNFQ